jgi:hypothetical protein
MPRQRIMPHDLFHFVVESTLAMPLGLYGHVALGYELRFDSELNPSRIDGYKSVELAQSESLVECLQAERWGGTVPDIHWMEILVLTCSTRGVIPPVLTREQLANLRNAIEEMSQKWEVLPVGGSIEIGFHPNTAEPIR